MIPFLLFLAMMQTGTAQPCGTNATTSHLELCEYQNGSWIECKPPEGLMDENKMEPDPKKWCGALLAYHLGHEVECNLPKGHQGAHRHVMEGEPCSF